MQAMISALVVGLIFGWILQKSRMTQYNRIGNY